MELTWRTVYDQAVLKFGGQRPGANLEQQIIDQFEQHPAAVIDAIEKLAARYTAGTVHSPWPLVLRELQHAPNRDAIVVTDEAERNRAITKTERWLKRVGYAIPDEADLMRELFGAPLQTADTDTLERIAALTIDTPLHQLATLQLKRTREHGRERIDAIHAGHTDDEGTHQGPRLAAYDTPELRARMAAIWRSTQPDRKAAAGGF